MKLIGGAFNDTRHIVTSNSNTSFYVDMTPQNNYYISGVVFMCCVIALLLYANFFYDYKFSGAWNAVINYKICCCLLKLNNNCIHLIDIIKGNDHFDNNSITTKNHRNDENTETSTKTIRN